METTPPARPRPPRHATGVPRHRVSARRSGHVPAERVWTVVGVLCIALVVVLAALADRIEHRDEALPGVTLDGIDVGGRSEAEILAVARLAAARAQSRPFTAVAGSTRLVAADPSALGATYDAEAAVRAVRRAGRQGPLRAIVDTFRRRAGGIDVAVPVRIDDGVLTAAVDEWQRQVGAGLTDGTIEIRGTAVIVAPPARSEGLVRPAADDRVRDALASGRTTGVVLPVRRTRPTIDRAATLDAARRARAVLARPVVLTVDGRSFPIDPPTVAAALGVRPQGRRLELTVDPVTLRNALAPALATIETSPKDADFAVNGTTVSVVPSVTGRQVDLGPVAAAIARGRHRVTGGVAAVSPARDTAWAQRLNITRLVSSYTTNHPCCQPRVTNIHTAAAALNGAIVEPGQTFSLNQHLGPRTLAKGYVVAPQIGADLSYEDSVGGGVSQLSTTLFNAVFFGGYQDVTHTVHALYIERYPMGREATLNYPSIDNRFRNDTPNGVLIRTAVSGTSITVSLYGDNGGRTVTAEGPNVLETIPIVDECFDPATTPPQKAVATAGQIGYRVENFRIIRFADGSTKRQRFSERYQMQPKRFPCPGAGPTGPSGPPPPEVPPTTAPPVTTTSAPPPP
ncbi:MAG: VanW family protein [Actinomycetes bacterium]